jgi:anaerobic ribonucleoside-triphosphate reductase activating protein
MLIHSIIDSSTVNGPGKRAVVWAQGCGLKCPGCWNSETHSFEAGRVWKAKDLAEYLLGLKDIEGVTFSGGEPMHQAAGLSMLTGRLKTERPNFSIGMYTGYTAEELDKGWYDVLSGLTLHCCPERTNYEWSKTCKSRWISIRSCLDFAVMGRFVQNQRETSRPLCSSRNQKLYLLSERYRIEDFRPQEAEVTITDETVSITGFPTGALL